MNGLWRGSSKLGRLTRFQRSLRLVQSSRFASKKSASPAVTELWNGNKHPRQRELEQQAAQQIQKGTANEKSANKEHDMSYLLSHPIWSKAEVNSVKIEHRPCEHVSDYLARGGVTTLRFGFDVLSGYFRGKMTEQKWLSRIIFLECVAGVPGMVAAMIRHLHSLRLMRRDYGWIHTL
eukprot:269576_1